MAEGDGEFFHYALGKMGASGGHLDPKKKGRTMCELFGAYGWGLDVPAMKQLADSLKQQGIPVSDGVLQVEDMVREVKRLAASV